MPSNIAVVTGANGFVGSHLVDYLLEKNYEVRCIVRKTSDLKWLSGKNVKIFDCGLLDDKGLNSAFNNADYIYHVAGVVKSKKPEGYFMGNVDTTDTLLKAALKNASTIKKIVIVSSLTAVGPSKNGIPVNEKDECLPITTYGRSKLAQENLAKSYMDKLPITICRAPAVFGERDTEIFIFFQTFNRGLMTTIGFDKKLVSLIHVRDLVEGFYLAAKNDKSKSETYFISSEEFYTWEQVGIICEKIFSKKPLKIKIPHSIVYSVAGISQFLSIFSKKAATLNVEKAKDITQNAWICDTSKAIRDLGYHQKISLEEGIKRTVDWYKQMKWL
jgi:nucleoside-diphosphate-sugar epimerase